MAVQPSRQGLHHGQADPLLPSLSTALPIIRCFISQTYFTAFSRTAAFASGSLACTQEDDIPGYQVNSVWINLRELPIEDPL